MKKRLKIYFDVCCYCRPFDDQSDDKIYLEAESILSILSRCEKGELVLISSQVVDYEIFQINDWDKKEKVLYSTSIANKKIPLDKKIIRRVRYFKNKGLKSMDAFHLACAESECDIFFTTDKKLLKKALSLKNKIKIKVYNPLKWMAEEIKW